MNVDSNRYCDAVPVDDNNNEYPDDLPISIDYLDALPTNGNTTDFLCYSNR